MADNNDSEILLDNPDGDLGEVTSNPYNDDDLSARGEVFKTKIIRMFHLLDFVGDEGELTMHTEGPELQTSDITDGVVAKQTLKNTPNCMVIECKYTDT